MTKRRLSKKSSRIKACELAAIVMAGRPNDNCAPLLWSLAVFFEEYIGVGASGTAREFGPKKPIKLRAIRNMTDHE